MNEKLGKFIQSRDKVTGRSGGALGPHGLRVSRTGSVSAPSRRDEFDHGSYPSVVIRTGICGRELPIQWRRIGN